MSYARVSRHFGPIWGPFWAFLGILSRKDSSSLKTRDVYEKNANRGNSTQKEQKRNEKWPEGSLIAFNMYFRVTVHQNKRNLGDFPHFSVFWWRPPRKSRWWWWAEAEQREETLFSSKIHIFLYNNWLPLLRDEMRRMSFTMRARRVYHHHYWWWWWW